MIFWRICKAARASTAFDGAGARLYPGRWNDRGVAIVYCAGSLALAALECFIHLDPDELPDDLVSIRVELPSGLAVDDIDVASLPADWRRTPGPTALRAIGTHWVARASAVALRVPSAIIPEEYNVLLNPAHLDTCKLRIDAPRAFVFDSRMRK